MPRSVQNVPMTEHLLDIQKRYKSKKELLRFLRNYVVSR